MTLTIVALVGMGVLVASMKLIVEYTPERYHRPAVLDPQRAASRDALLTYLALAGPAIEERVHTQFERLERLLPKD